MLRNSTKKPLLSVQIARIADASFTILRYAVLIEDDPLETFISTMKVFAPVAYGTKMVNPSQLKSPYMQKNSSPCRNTRI